MRLFALATLVIAAIAYFIWYSPSVSPCNALDSEIDMTEQPQSDESKRTALIQSIREQDPDAGSFAHWGLSDSRPLVTVEAFFDGNHDLGSIGPNLLAHPGIETFAQTLRALRDRQDVQDVWIGITEIEENTTGVWPFTDTIYILTTASTDTISGHLSALCPDEVSPLPANDPQRSRLLAPLTPSHNILYAWWD